MKFDNELRDTKPAACVRVKTVKAWKLKSAGTLTALSFIQKPFLIKLSKSVLLNFYLSVNSGWNCSTYSKPVSVGERN